MRRIIKHVVAATCAGLIGITGSLAAMPGASAVNLTLPNLVSASPAANTPQVLNGSVVALAKIGTTVYVGGDFTRIRNVGGAEINQPYLFAYDDTTGIISTTFVPALDNIVNALDTDGTSLYVAGRFTTISGVPRNRVAKVDPATGSVVTAFRANVSGTVEDMVVRNAKVYLGGTFRKVNREARERLAAVDATTGALDTDLNIPVSVPGWTPGKDKVSDLDVSPDGSKLVIAGAFNTVGGLPRWQVAVIDLTTSPDTVANWRTRAFDWLSRQTFTCMHDVDFSADGSYFVLGSMCGNLYYGDAVNRWNPSATGDYILPQWSNATGYDTIWSVATTGTVVYAGGHQKWSNGAPQNGGPAQGVLKRPGLSAFDATTGAPLSWNPGRKRGVGAFALLATDTGLIVGHDTETVAKQYRPRLARFPLLEGALPAAPAQPLLPGTLYSLSSASTSLSARTFDGVTAGAPTTADTTLDWSKLRGAWSVAGRVYASDTGNGNRLTAWPFNGTISGSPYDVNTKVGYINVNTFMPLNGSLGAAWDGGWLYYVNPASTNLMRRGFALENDGMTTEVQVVSGPAVDGINWSTARGLAIAGGKLIFANTTGNLTTMTFTSGKPVAGTQSVVSGPALDGVNWSTTTGLFVGN